MLNELFVTCKETKKCTDENSFCGSGPLSLYVCVTFRYVSVHLFVVIVYIFHSCVRLSL